MDNEEPNYNEQLGGGMYNDYIMGQLQEANEQLEEENKDLKRRVKYMSRELEILDKKIEGLNL